jgi:hypothetical protein
MAAYDGVAIAPLALFSSNTVFDVRGAGTVFAQLTPYSSVNRFDIRSAGAVFLNTAIKKSFRKRAWRTESGAYVVWDTVFEDDPYPEGGTLDPPLGVIVALL